MSTSTTRLPRNVKRWRHRRNTTSNTIRPGADGADGPARPDAVDRLGDVGQPVGAEPGDRRGAAAHRCRFVARRTEDDTGAATIQITRHDQGDQPALAGRAEASRKRRRRAGRSPSPGRPSDASAVRRLPDRRSTSAVAPAAGDRGRRRTCLARHGSPAARPASAAATARLVLPAADLGVQLAERRGGQARPRRRREVDQLRAPSVHDLGPDDGRDVLRRLQPAVVGQLAPARRRRSSGPS